MLNRLLSYKECDPFIRKLNVWVNCDALLSNEKKDERSVATKAK